MRIVVPLPSSLSISTCPPDCLMKPYTWLSPRPVPLPAALVVKNGSKALRLTSAVMPCPVSVIAIIT